MYRDHTDQFCRKCAGDHLYVTRAVHWQNTKAWQKIPARLFYSLYTDASIFNNTSPTVTASSTVR